MRFLITEDEARRHSGADEMFVVQPSSALWFGYDWQDKGKLLQDGFRYTSEDNPEWLTEEQIRAYVAPFNRIKWKKLNRSLNTFEIPG